MDLINTLVSCMYDFNTFCLQNICIGYLKSSLLTYFRGVIVMYGIYIGTDQIWT